MNGDTPPRPRMAWSKRALQNWRKRSLGTRLFLAFAVLILGLAVSAIIIADVLASSRTKHFASVISESDLSHIDSLITHRLDDLDLLATSFAASIQVSWPDCPFADALRQRQSIDVILVFEPSAVYRVVYEDQVLGVFAPLDADSADRVRGTALADMVLAVRTSAEPRTGLVVLDGSQLAAVGMQPMSTPVLYAFAAAPIQVDRVLVLGMSWNGRAEYLFASYAAPDQQGGSPHGASLFLGDTRIATTLSDTLVGQRASPDVARRTLGRAERSFGRIQVAEQVFVEAYQPLQGFDGKVIGMVAAATRQNAMGATTGHIMLLFSSIILLASLVALSMSYIYSHRFVRPLKEMAEGMHRVAEGDLNHKVRTASGDELGRLSSAFNAMVRAVKERDMRLSEITEERLSRMEKQVSIGRLAAGVAHEINNPLTAVLSLSSLLLKHAAPEDPDREDLEMIVTETTRCRTIVRSLLEYAREHPTKMRILDINDLLREALVLCGNYRALAQKETDLKFSNTPLLVLGDWHGLQQVFINLLINAGEATRPGQTISIESDEDSSGGFVVVKVKDTGKGIPKEHLNRIFEPFFTTKGTGRGTGLGLSVSIGIIQKHNGFIEIDSEVGKGTTVSVTLPRVKEETTVIEPPGAGASTNPTAILPVEPTQGSKEKKSAM